jgi:plasmid stabilization system protein ParE
MAQIIWTKLAFADLDAIYDYIAKESPFYAQKTVEGLLSSVEFLSSFPEAGRQVPECMRKEIREVIEGNYRIFYKVGKKDVYIIRVHHAARNIKGRRRRTNL